MDGSLGKQVLQGSGAFRLHPAHLRLPREIRPNQRILISLNLPNGSLGDNLAAVGSGLGPHLDKPVRLGQNLSVMVHQKDRISIRH